MRYPLPLTHALLIATTIFLTVTVTKGIDCTPIGTHIRDTTTGACGFANSSMLGKAGLWYIEWPDGAYDELTAKGGGFCSWQSRCDTLPILDSIYCWPDFYPPLRTATGGFSILVVNQAIESVEKRCGLSVFVEVRKSCTNAGQTIWEKNRPCRFSGGGCDFDLEFDGGGSSVCECYPDSPDCVSPILIDVEGNGFELSNASTGVDFDIRAEGASRQISWTVRASDDAWLALDRNGNGHIDDGSELFGNFTPQPSPPVDQQRNGFLALAEYDKPNNGGNGDRVITQIDTIFSSLRLWQDRNHNGISEAAELVALHSIGVKKIELDYKDSKKRDEHGNYFRYRAKVSDEQDTNVSRWAWDVFLVTL